MNSFAFAEISASDQRPICVPTTGSIVVHFESPAALKHLEHEDLMWRQAHVYPLLERYIVLHVTNPTIAGRLGWLGGFIVVVRTPKGAVLWGEFDLGL